VSDAPVLLYDGSCGFCEATVQLVLRHDRRQTLRFAPLQGEYGGALRARHPELAGTDSIIWVDPASDDAGEGVRVKSAAALRVAEYLGFPWAWFRVLGIVPRPLRDAVYDLVARHRHRIPLGPDRCALPTPEARQRFMP
jgi:predicted DCC family thiol-disulfide oxidoreductase YuxK